MTHLPTKNVARFNLKALNDYGEFRFSGQNSSFSQLLFGVWLGGIRFEC